MNGHERPFPYRGNRKVFKGTTHPARRFIDVTQNDRVSDAFYEPAADPAVYFATDRTSGPWERGVQHAGPPSALVTRAIELLPSSIPGPAQLARVTVEILGPVRTGEVAVRAEVTRPGKTVELVEAELLSGGRPAMRARAWRIRTAELALPDGLDKPAASPPPIPPEESTFEQRGWLTGYLGAVAFHFTRGHFQERGPAAAWTRLKVALVAGEEPTPTQRLMAVADSGNGISSLLPPDQWWFINTDLTVHLHRVPLSEWIFMSSQSTLDISGVGLAETELFDEKGRVGRGAQALMVGPR
jgi:hypothetical protein